MAFPVHGVILRDGDILSVDVGAIYEGFHGDAAITLAIGGVDDGTAALDER